MESLFQYLPWEAESIGIPKNHRSVLELSPQSESQADLPEWPGSGSCADPGRLGQAADIEESTCEQGDYYDYCYGHGPVSVIMHFLRILGTGGHDMDVFVYIYT